MRNILLLLCSLALVWGSGQGLPIDGCPLWGCRPSGTFSFTLDVPKVNATVDWVSDFFIGPVPNFGGCVGNSESLVCQSNGPGPADTGYMAVDAIYGTVSWRDPILRFPTLPVMDAYGDVWGSDGGQIMTYDNTGKPMGPQIPVDPNMRPLFDMQIINSNILLLVSENGQISMLLTDGTPFASTVLHGTVERDNGTFLPVAPPVVNGNRFYVITEFSPDNKNSANMGLQRLYAIDTHQSMTGRVKIAWYANFEKEAPPRLRNALSRSRRRKVPSGGSARLIYRPKTRTVAESLRDADLNPSILWDDAGQMLFLSLPPPMLANRRVSDGPARFIGIKDGGDSSALMFQSERSVVNMALYEDAGVSTNLGHGLNRPFADTQLWVSLPNGTLQAISRSGDVSKTIDLQKMLNITYTITSKMMTTKKRDLDEDFLIFGIHVTSKSERFLSLAHELSVSADSDYYIVGYDTPENKASTMVVSDQGRSKAGLAVAWMIPTPGNRPVTGQIVGVSGYGHGYPDRIVAFAQDQSAGKLFSIVRKT